MHRRAGSSPSRASAFGRDALASVIVFLVAMPLCLGIARPCGVPPAADLLTGVITGLVLSTLKLLSNFTRLSVRRIEVNDPKRSELYLEGAATFLRLPRLAAELERTPPGAELHVHFDKLSYIDHACLELLMNWEKQHAATGGTLVIDWDVLRAKFRPVHHRHRAA